MMKDEEVRCIAAVESFKVVDKKSQELITKLTKVERDKRSAEVALDGVEEQVKAQHKQLCQTKADLASARDQVKILSKKLEEVGKAEDQAEQDGYEVVVAETEEALRVEVSEVCRYYYLHVWNEALNQAGVEAFFALRRAEILYYPPTT